HHASQGVACACTLSRRADHVENDATAAGPHALEGEFCQTLIGERLEVHGALHGVAGDVTERACRYRSRVVDQDVDGTCLVHKVITCTRCGQIDSDVPYLYSALPRNSSCQLIQLRTVSCGKNEVATFLAQRLGDCLPDALGGAGYQRC